MQRVVSIHLNGSAFQLEEAAYVSGARPWRTLWRVFLPLMLPTFVGVWIWVVLHAVRIAGLPLILYEGPRNQVLSILIWNMWDQGYVPAVAAIGTLLMLTLLLLTLAVRYIGFRRQFVQSPTISPSPANGAWTTLATTAHSIAAIAG